MLRDPMNSLNKGASYAGLIAKRKPYFRRNISIYQVAGHKSGRNRAELIVVDQLAEICYDWRQSPREMLAMFVIIRSGPF